jgi:4-hydroxy-2-oxoheptanedioate aldolase
VKKSPAAPLIRKTILGIWQLIPSPTVSRLLARQGWDWIILDRQHGSPDSRTTYECIHAIRAEGAKPLVRVPIGAGAEVSKYLDLGAQGIVVPMVNSAAEARTMALAAKYPPLGERSMGGDARLYYGEDYPERANQETLLIVQIEHIRAVRSVEKIMAVRGVDGCFVGPTDLAMSMGLPRTGYESNPAHRAAIRRTAEVCRKLKKLACCNTYSLADAQEKRAQGFECISFETEVQLLMKSGETACQGLRRAVSRS